MKRILNFILIIVLMICMIFGLTACGENNSSNKSNSNKGSSSESENETVEETKVGDLSLELERVLEFSEGLCAIKKDGKWGYMDKTGKIVIDCSFDEAKSFSEGLAVVKKDGKCGYINNKGEVVIDFKYDSADSFSFGYGVGYIGRRENIVIDKSGNEIIKKSYSMIFGPISENLFIIAPSTGMYAVVDKDENILLDEIKQAGKKVDGYIPVQQWGNGDKWGFIDEQGQLVIDYTYDFAGPFVDGIAGIVKDGKIGYINKDNEFVIEAKYPYKDTTVLRDYSCGLVKIADDDKVIYFDKNGKEVFTRERNTSRDFINDMAIVENSNEEYGYMDTKGNVVIDYQYFSTSNFTDDGLAKVYTDEFENFKFIDKNGKTILAGTTSDEK